MKTFEVSDERGNLLKLFNNGIIIIVNLKLVSENKFRNIGTINIKNRDITIKRNRKKHLFKKIFGYGFNHKLLKETKLFDNIRFIDDYDEWLIPKSHILENGKFLLFSQQGFELQIFISLLDITQFKKEPKF